MKRVALSIARDRLSLLVNEVAHGNGRIVLESHGRPKAALVCIEDLRRLESAPRRDERQQADMMRWLAETEQLLDGPRRGDRSVEALEEVRGERVADEPGVYRRQRRAKTGGRRKR